GALVRTLTEERREAGTHVANWNGRDEAGQRVASGTYNYVLTMNDRAVTRHMVVVN
ncbi:MAG: hypothetical protein KFH87_04765, partial [Bacteroidetes bacterium]|nr:hypothetical protein [Bacteroidota bacterium]